MSLENVLLSIALESLAAVEAKERGAIIPVIANGLDRGWWPCLKSMEKRGLIFVFRERNKHYGMLTKYQLTEHGKTVALERNLPEWAVTKERRKAIEAMRCKIKQ